MKKLLLLVPAMLGLLSVLVYAWAWIPGEPVILVDRYEDLVKELRRSNVPVLLPPEEAFSSEDLYAYVDVHGRTRLSRVGGYYVRWGQTSIDCYIPRPDEREKEGHPGYMTYGNGSIYWEAPPPIWPNEQIGTAEVEVLPQVRTGDWQARFEHLNCRYTVKGTTREAVLNMCCFLLDLSADSDRTTETDDSIKEAYQYKVVPGTSEWEELGGKAEREAACWISSSVLERMTTQALVETILTYPFFIDVYAFDTLELGFSIAPPQGLNVLLEREDAAETTQAVAEARLKEFGVDSIEWLYANTLQEYISQRDIRSS